ncbi:MAG: acyl-CoA dehydrogenase family protein [Desulfobacterales bacterium]|nr:acyl-CoA dehydrogenase family protein [Desulfobacterales bacterium]MDX2512271.1 acyl-CoA dehydrogenase family protein [Desulfobacterales bacterium]
METTATPEFKQLHSNVRKLVKETLNPIFEKVEKEAKIPEHIADKFRRLGLFGMSIPRQYGGLGLSTIEEMSLIEEMTYTNACFRSRVGTNNSIGSMGIVFDGTNRQKEQYLPRIASGEWTTSFALTEPNAGSDASGIITTAELDGDHWVLNGNKIFITNADTARLFTTIAVTDEKKRARGGVTAFLVERGTPGFSIGPTDLKMGFKGSHTCELVFKDCRVPKENVIGGMEMVGQGFKTAMRVLDKGRLVAGACALGASQKIMDISIVHLKKNLASEKSRDALQAAQFVLADMATQIFAARQMLYHSARLKDEGKNITNEAAMVKVFLTETASRVADSAMDILGEEGCLTKNQVEILLRDVRLYRIYEGTSEIQRTIISRNLLKN